MDSFLSNAQLRRTFLAALTIACNANAQDINIDWSQSDASKAISCPSEISHSLNSRIVVSNVNDFFYDYSVNLVSTPRATDDFALIAGAILTPPVNQGRAGPLVIEDPCVKNLRDLKTHADMIRADTTKLLPTLNGTAYGSISVRQTEAAWLGLREEINTLRSLFRALDNCSTQQKDEDYKKIAGEIKTYDKWDQLIGQGHQNRSPVQLDPDHDFVITVTERFSGVVTENGSRQYSCKPQSGVLTLSAGFLASGVRTQTFSSVRVPQFNNGQLLNTTYNALAVDGGSGPSMNIPLLLNYALPFSARWTNYLAVSAGPTFRVSPSSSDTSTFGVFAGISFNIYKRFYLSSGVHFAEFADFPLGFAPGYPIPDGFGELRPITRWTGKLAFAVTFKTNDFTSANRVAASARSIQSPQLPLTAVASNGFVPIDYKSDYSLTFHPKINGGQPPYNCTFLPPQDVVVSTYLTIDGTTCTVTGSIPANESNPPFVKFTIRVTDSAKSQIDASYSIPVTPAPLTIGAPSYTLVTSATAVTLSRADPIITGGTRPYTCEVSNFDNNIWMSLTIESTCKNLAGTIPMDAPIGAGPLTFDIKVTDANKATGTVTYTIPVALAGKAPSMISPIIPGNEYSLANADPQIIGGGGTLPYQCSVSDYKNTIWALLEIDTNCKLLKGLIPKDVPLGPGPVTFTINVTDSKSNPAAMTTIEYAIPVTLTGRAPDMIAPISRATGYVLAAEPQIIGGSAPYKCEIVNSDNGIWMSSLKIDPDTCKNLTGTIPVGAPLGTGPVTFDINVTDSNGTQTTVRYSIMVNP